MSLEPKQSSFSQDLHCLEKARGKKKRLASASFKSFLCKKCQSQPSTRSLVASKEKSNTVPFVPFKRKRSARHAEVLSRASEDMPLRKLTRYFLSLLMIMFLNGCNIYNGGFQRGGELTSSFLERIEETPNDQEDFLVKKEMKKCSK